MNKKAEKFSAMLKDNAIDCFEAIETKDELQTVIYRSAMEVGGQRLPVVIIIDQSIFVIVRTVVASNCLSDEGARARVERRLGELNGQYKVFKYYVRDDSLILDMCVPMSETGFEPDVVRFLLDLAIKHLAETFPVLMETVWGKEEK
ncbi:MAG: YbjN domain-containing protein [Candidatus Accumulibacter sp.]|nr:YbjN domain-containing protein [Accumulibacter sp.]